MQTASLHANARADGRDRACPDLLERRIARYQPRFRPRVLALAARHPRLKDLALSFPALLFALAVPRPGYDRERICALVIDGAPLRDLAALTQLPLWLRRLPPEAFSGPIALLPDGAFASRQVVNHIPRSPKKVSSWLKAVGTAMALGDDAVAVWMARAWHKQPTWRRHRDELRWMCLWAWFARHVPDDPCKLKTAWGPGLSFELVQRLSREWRTNVGLYIKIGDEPLANMWLRPGHVGGFDMVALKTYADIADEAVAMKHCVRWYGDDLVENWCRLWSVRRNGERVATFEIRQADESPFLHIAQMKMAGDKRAPEGLWNIVQMWLRAQDAACPGVSERPDKVPAAHMKAWRRMWRPYWLAKRHFPDWLPLTPTHATFDAF